MTTQKKKTTEIAIEYKPFPQQLAFHNSEARIRALIAGIGGGKTIAGANEMVKQVLTHNKTYGVCISATYRMLQDVVLPILEQYLPKKMIRSWSKSDNIFSLINGSKIQLMSADNPDRLRGIGPDFIWIDEGRELSKYAWNVIYTRATRGKRAKVWVTTTPNGKDWVYNEIYAQWYFNQHPSYFCVLYKSVDNPYFDPEMAKEARGRMREAFYKQEYEASFEQFTGRVYKDFDRNIHVIDRFKIPTDWQIFRSIDFGYTNPFACLWIAVDFDNNIYVVDEHYMREQTTSYHAAVIKQKDGNMRIQETYGDPSAKQFIKDLAKEQIYIKPAVNDVIFGIDKVAAALKVNKHLAKPKLFIFRHCRNIIEEFENYRYRQEREYDETDETKPNPKEEPLKKNDHAMDALRYFFATRAKIESRENESSYVKEFGTAYQPIY